MRKQKKSESAVTLISLIISIIVLLILAGVSLTAIMRRKWDIKSSNKCGK